MDNLFVVHMVHVVYMVYVVCSSAWRGIFALLQFVVLLAAGFGLGRFSIPLRFNLLFVVAVVGCYESGILLHFCKVGSKAFRQNAGIGKKLNARLSAYALFYSGKQNLI